MTQEGWVQNRLGKCGGIAEKFRETGKGEMGSQDHQLQCTCFTPGSIVTSARKETSKIILGGRDSLAL